jgi:hypothetical protein
MPDQAAFLRSLAKLYPDGPHSPWYIFVGLVLQANDRMDAIAALFEILREQTPNREDLITKVRTLREAQLKASVLIGFPKVSIDHGFRTRNASTDLSPQGINGCIALRNAVQETAPELLTVLDKDPSLRENLSRQEKDSRGLAFFQRIYSQHTDRVLENMSLASGGDLSQFAINAVYGDLMAEERRLGAKETGLLEFLACYAAG